MSASRCSSLPSVLEQSDSPHGGSDNEREGAKIELQAINGEIEIKNLREFSTLPGEGGIEVENWYEAGHQLKLAVRDALHYNSTARYEDIRDFVWERIQNRHYPNNWRAKRSDFEEKVGWHRRSTPLLTQHTASIAVIAKGVPLLVDLGGCCMQAPLANNERPQSVCYTGQSLCLQASTSRIRVSATTENEINQVRISVTRGFC